MAAMQHPSPTHAHQSNTTTKQSTIIMEKLKSSIIQRLTKLQPNKTLSPSQINCIQLQLQHAFPSFHIPTHPTYSTMIEKAVEELNEEEGSSEEAISEFIVRNYKDLPWAHKRFLSYYLDKLCKANEVVCISSNRYSVPRLMDKFSWQKKRLELRSQVYSSEVDNLDGNEENVNVGLVQGDEEETGVSFKRRVKRKRSSLVVQDDEEGKVGGTWSVERHNDVVENSEVPVNDDGNISGGRVEAEEKDDTNQEHDLAACDKFQSLVAVEGGSQLAPSRNLDDAVKSGNTALAHDPREEKDEQLVPTVYETLPREHEEEVRTEALLSDHTISGANIMLVPSVSNEPMDGGRVVALVSAFDFPKDTLDKLVLERKDQDSCSADLKIVAVEKGNPKSAERREIVCCLPVPLQQPKISHAYRPRKKSKQCQEGKSTTSATPIDYPNITKGAKLADNEGLRESTRTHDMKLNPKLSESSVLESPLQSQKGHMSSAFGSNLMMSVIEGSVEHEHGKQKLHSDSFPSSPQSELMSMEDGELSIPLKRVQKMHGKQKKSSLHANMLKMVACFEDPEKKIPQKGMKKTRHKRKQQVLQYDGQKCCSSEVVVALKTPYEMQGKGQPGLPQVKATIDALIYDNQHHELVEDEQMKGDHGLFHRPGQYDINPQESSQGGDENALKDLTHPTEHHQQQERPSEPPTDLLLEKIPEEENDGGIANSPLESPSVKSSSPSQHGMKDGLQQNGCDVQLQGIVPDSTISMKGKSPRSNQPSPQKEKEVKKIECRGRPSKNKNETQNGARSVHSHFMKQGGLFDTVSYQQMDPQNKQRKKDDGRRSTEQKEAKDIILLKLRDQQLEEQSKLASCQSSEASADDVAASVRLNGQKQGLSDSGICQQSDRMTLREQVDATKEAVSLNLHDLRKLGPLEPETRKVRKKDGRGRPRKIKEATIKDVPAPLDLYAMQQKELDQAVICQSENKDGGQNSVRQTEPVTQDVGAKGLYDLDLQEQELPFKPAIHPSPDVSNVFCEPGERKGQQQNVTCPVYKLPATLEGPISLRTRSKHGRAHNPEAPETLLVCQADNLGEELVPVHPDKESHRKEVVSKTDQEKKQWQCSSDNLGESQAEVDKAPSKSEETNISDDVTLLLDQPFTQEKQHQNPVKKQGRQLRSHTTVPEQKPHDHIPPSAIRRSSRINQQSHIGSICTKFFLPY